MGSNLISITAELRDALKALPEPKDIEVYHPLQYAWALHRRWLLRFVKRDGEQFTTQHRRVLFLGMNPGPFGMMQTACPFGDIESARVLAGVDGRLCSDRGVESFNWDALPTSKRRRLQGFACSRREVSGTRFWSCLSELWPRPDHDDGCPHDDNFADKIEHMLCDAFVMNYCPLAFIDCATGKNVTPDKLPEDYLRATHLHSICEAYLEQVLLSMGIEIVVAVGKWPQQLVEALLVCTRSSPAASACRVQRVCYMPHPSPSNPAANRGWINLAADTLRKAGIL